MVGHIVSKEGIGTNPKKIEAIVGILFPTTKRGIRTFLGITSYHRRFIHKYAIIAKPLTRFLKDDAPPLLATPGTLEAFDKLKHIILFV